MKRLLTWALVFALAAGAAMGVTAEEVESTLPVEAPVEEQENFELPPSANGVEAADEPSDGAEDANEAPDGGEAPGGDGESPQATAPEGSEALARRTRRIQTWLIVLGYLNANQLTGEYDDATRAAVAMFQQDHRLEATGECDEATYVLLMEAATAADPTPPPSAPATKPTPTPAPTASSPTAREIRQAQSLLVSLKYLSEDDATGELNDATIAALLRFQAANDLEETGLLDVATLALIEKLAESEGKSGASSSKSSGSSSASKSGGGVSASATSDPRLHGVTPGKALTSSHSRGDKDASRYGSVDLSGGAKALNVTLMTGDGDGELRDGSYRSQVADRVLTLSGGDGAVQRWEFDGAALRALNRSGVDRLTLTGGSGHASLPTGGTLSGAVYEDLRSHGFTDNTFTYIVTLSGDGVDIAVDARGRRFAAEKDADGALILSGEAS